jgi:hypothetical protein
LFPCHKSTVGECAISTCTKQRVLGSAAISILRLGVDVDQCWKILRKTGETFLEVNLSTVRSAVFGDVVASDHAEADCVQRMENFLFGNKELVDD